MKHRTFIFILLLIVVPSMSACLGGDGDNSEDGDAAADGDGPADGDDPVDGDDPTDGDEPADGDDPSDGDEAIDEECFEGSGSIGATGGCVEITSGEGAGSRIDIAANALSENVEIGLNVAASIAGDTSTLGSAISLTPDGQQFSEAVTITLPRSEAKDLSVFVAVESTDLDGLIANAWLDVSAGSVKFTTKHFSTYEPVNPREAIPSDFSGKWTQSSCVSDTIESIVETIQIDEDGNADFHINSPDDGPMDSCGFYQFKDEGGGLYSYSIANSVPVYVTWTDADHVVFAMGENFSGRIVGDLDPESDNNNIEEDRYCNYQRTEGESAIYNLEGRWELVDCLTGDGIEDLRNSYWVFGPDNDLLTDPEQNSDLAGFYYPNAAGTKFIADLVEIITGYIRRTDDTIIVSYHSPYIGLDEVPTDETGDHSCTYSLSQ